MNIRILTALVLVPIITLSSAAANITLEKQQSTFISELTRIRETYNEKKEKLATAYSDAISTLLNKVQEQGELEPVVAIKKEQERFKEEGDIPESALTENIPQLHEMQVGFNRTLSSISLEEAGRIVNLARMYDRSLEKMQKNMVRGGDLQNAAKVKDERDSLWKIAAVKSSQTLLASAPAEPVETASNKPDKTTPQQKPTLTRKPSRAERSKIETSIRKRYEEFCDTIIARDFEAACEYIEPDFLKTNGQKSAIQRLQWIFPFLKATENKKVKLAVDDVELSEDADSAKLTPKLWAGNKWHSLPPNNWIRVNNQWYIKIDASTQNNQNNSTQPGSKRSDRPRRRRR